MSRVAHTFYLLIGAAVGFYAALGLFILVMGLLTSVATYKLFDTYIALGLLAFSVMILLKLYKKSRLDKNDIRTESITRDYEVDFETNKLIKKPANKGGLASELTNATLSIRESSLLSSKQNLFVNEINFYLELGVSLANILSCMAVIALEKDWLPADDSHRASIYMLISLSFTCSFVVLMKDVVECALVCINLASNQLPGTAPKPPLISNAMLLFLILNALSLGMYFGFIFGLKDTQGDQEQTTNLFSMHLGDNAYYAPMGLFLGANTGFWLMMIWANEMTSFGDKRRCKY